MMDEWEVYCELGGHYVPEWEAVEVGERIGPDMMPYPVYHCFNCCDDIDEIEDEEKS